MSIINYKEVLLSCKETIAKKLAPLHVKEQRKKAELEVCKLEATIAEKEQKIQEIASEYPIAFEKLLDAIDDLELTQRRKEQFERIINEMFGE